MLDVHPPHEAAHSWKDFFIHIATIVIGLLIAVGLEQTVEWLHHKSEIRETRRLLKEERKQNVDVFHRNVAYTRKLRAFLQNDLRVFLFLQQHPGTPPEKLPGVLVWAESYDDYAQSSWMSAKQTNVLALMPQAEVEDARLLYDILTRANEKDKDTWAALNKADAYEFIQPDPSKLTRAQLDDEILLIRDCLRLVYIRLVALNNIGEMFADFAPEPTYEELRSFHRTYPHPINRFSTGIALTQHDIDDARALDKADKPGIQFSQEISEHGAVHSPEIYQQFHARYPDFKPNEIDVNNLGDDALGKGDMPGAIASFKLNVQLYPDSWFVYDRLGKAYAKAGQNKLAIENYQHALKLDPTAQSSIDALAKLQK
jgi:tetratricopeptide (TPR) repeat protein